jgi:hypothetical protein
MIGDYLVSYKFQARPITFTLVAMGIITVIFYPLFMRLESWVENFSRKILKGGKSLTGKYLGLFLAFFGSLVILTYFYAKSWYHIDLLRILFHGEIGKYI